MLSLIASLCKSGPLAAACPRNTQAVSNHLFCCVVLCSAGLSSDTAMSLLLAVWPLCRVRSDLQDFVVMLLRKMMYRQDVDGRWAGGGLLRGCLCSHGQDTCLTQHTNCKSWQCPSQQPTTSTATTHTYSGKLKLEMAPYTKPCAAL